MSRGLPLKTVKAKQATAADLNVTEASAAAIKTAVELIDNAIAGTEMQVDVVAALPAGTNPIGKLAANSGVDIGDVDVTSLPTTVYNSEGEALAKGILLQGSESSLRKNIIASSSGGLHVELRSGAAAFGSSGTPVRTDPTGTTPQPVSGTVTASNATGNVAHDGVDSGNPVKIGMKAIAHGTNPTAVAAADRTDWLANRAGVPFVVPGHPNVVTRSGRFVAAQTDLDIIGAIGAGTKVVVLGVAAMCDNANTVDVKVRVGFGATTIPTDTDNTMATGVLFHHPGIAKGSGAVVGGSGAILGVGADGEELRMTCEVPTGGSVTVTITYYTIES